MWWLVLFLVVVVLYLTYKLSRLYAWAKQFHEAVIAQFTACGCPQDPTWPPKPPDPWP
jgi:hypothetical protein